MPKVLVSDALAPQGLEILERAEGIEVEYRPGLAPGDLLEAIADADALVIRSGTKVTEDVIAAAPSYSRLDSVTGETTPLPGLDTEEGREILRNWLSCRVPVVERTEPMERDGHVPFGSVVSVTRPISRAVAASTGSPVSTSCSAQPSPTKR